MASRAPFRPGRTDIVLYLAFLGYAACSMVIPVSLVAMADTLHFPLAAGGMEAGGRLHAIRSAGIVLSLIGCGFLAFRFGKRRSLGSAVLVMGGGLLLCCAARWGVGLAAEIGYPLVAAALLAAGLGEGVVEGLATPYVQELHPDDPARYVNFAHTFWPIGVTLTVLVVGWLLKRGCDWAILMAAIAAGSMLVGAVLLRMRSADPVAPPPEPVLPAARVIFRRPLFWFFFAAMFLAGGAEFSLTFWGASYVQLDLHGSAATGGVVLAAYSIGMIAGRSGAGLLVTTKRLFHLLMVCAAAGALFAALLPRLAGWTGGGVAAACLLFFCNGVAVAPFWPSLQCYASDRMPEVDNTVLMILLSAAGIPGCGAFSWLLGWLGNQVGLSQAFWVVPGCFVVMAAMLFFDRRFVFGR